MSISIERLNITFILLFNENILLKRAFYLIISDYKIKFD